MSSGRFGVFIGVLTLLAWSAPAAASPVDTMGLRPQIERLVSNHLGVAGVSIRLLDTGEHMSVRGDQAFPSASLIKVSVLVGLMRQVERGEVGLAERLTLNAGDRVGGSGVLKHLAPGLEPTVLDAAWLMTVLSDNTATNLLLDRLGLESIWATMDELELPRTRVHRRVFQPNDASPLPDSAAVYGLGVTTPDETTRLFELLHLGEAVNPELDSLALVLLRANQDASKMVRWLPAGLPVAHKSGDIDRARNDCGILYAPAGPVALCVMTRENADTRFAVDNPAHLLIGRIARAVFQHLNPDAELPPLPDQVGAGSRSASPSSAATP